MVRGYVRFQTEMMLSRKLIQSTVIPDSYSINTDETNSSFASRQRANTDLISKLLCNIKLQQWSLSFSISDDLQLYFNTIVNGFIPALVSPSCSSSSEFGCTDPSIFGVPIPIMSLVSSLSLGQLEMYVLPKLIMLMAPFTLRYVSEWVVGTPAAKFFSWRIEALSVLWSLNHFLRPCRRWQTSRQPCSGSAVSTSGMWKSRWEQARSWTSTLGANHTLQSQVRPNALEHPAHLIFGYPWWRSPPAGLYPLVGWKIGSEVVYLAEGNAADTGTAIRWAQQLGEASWKAPFS